MCIRDLSADLQSDANNSPNHRSPV
jgi:hypothetical protein